jgi:hypothetical protein
MTNDSRADMLFSFLRRRGVGALSTIVEQLNNGTAQKRIAVMLGMDAGQFSRFVSSVLVNEYRVAPEVADMIELFQQLERRNAERAIGHGGSMGERNRAIASWDTTGHDPRVSRSTRILTVHIMADRGALGIDRVQCFFISARAVPGVARVDTGGQAHGRGFNYLADTLGEENRMRWIAVLVLASLLSGNALAQDSAQWVKFEKGKKNVGTALVWSFFLPGAGHIYANNNDVGFGFIMSEFVLMIWYTTSRESAGFERVGYGPSQEVYQRNTTPLYLAAAVRLVDFITSIFSVNKYNDALLGRITVGATPNGIGVRIML